MINQTKIKRLYKIKKDKNFRKFFKNFKKFIVKAWAKLKNKIKNYKKFWYNE